MSQECGDFKPWSRNPAAGFGLVITVSKGVLSQKPLGTEFSYVPKEGSWQFIHRWFYSESLLWLMEAENVWRH